MLGQVFKIYVGSGKALFTVRFFGFGVEFRAIPIGGLVEATHRNIERLRVKEFAFVVAGPFVNLLLAAAVWPFLDAEQLWSFRPMAKGLQYGLTFFYANLAMLVLNLWPHNAVTMFGALPSDGTRLFFTFLLSHEKRELLHAMNFAMEASVCHKRGDYEGARSWAERGLALYPDNETLLIWDGTIGLERMEYEKARECFLKLLHRDSKQPLMRPLMLNNIAYTNALLGGDELLKEADEFSQQAMTAVSWMPAVRGTRGTVLAAMGRFEEALTMLHEAMAQAESVNHKASNACMIAMAESRRGNFVVARNYLEEARKLEPRCSLLPRAETVLREASLPNR
jgi:tetratricopeptide (TPR) repeat protein